MKKKQKNTTTAIFKKNQPKRWKRQMYRRYLKGGQQNCLSLKKQMFEGVEDVWWGWGYRYRGHFIVFSANNLILVIHFIWVTLFWQSSSETRPR